MNSNFIHLVAIKEPTGNLKIVRAYYDFVNASNSLQPMEIVLSPIPIFDKKTINFMPPITEFPPDNLDLDRDFWKKDPSINDFKKPNNFFNH